MRMVIVSFVAFDISAKFQPFGAPLDSAPGHAQISVNPVRGLT
jgi:hypothetical protein